MKISFPYMGCVTGYKKFLELLGHEVIMPDKPSQRTVDLGVLNSPEFICYPFKIMMGTYIELCENGVDVIISSGGSGPCRAGMYCAIHQKVLKSLGYNTELLIFDSIFRDFKEFKRKAKMILNGNSIFTMLKHLRLAFRMICQMDKLQEKIKILRAYEVNRGDFDTAWDEITEIYDKCMKLSDLKDAHAHAEKILESVEVKIPPENKRLKIGIVGEIYVIMESSTNMEVEKRLNALGVEVTNVQDISSWVKHNILPRRINRSKSWKVYDMGKKYKRYACGGHDMENTGWIAEFAKEGYDGIVHMMPFGCLPELVTRSIIPELCDELGMPILSVSLDEQMGEANFQTRLEAFVDLCRKKKTYNSTGSTRRSPEKPADSGTQNSENKTAVHA